eukprot:1146153-Pelagomonas_calceolata.AAC.1
MEEAVFREGMSQLSAKVQFKGGSLLEEQFGVGPFFVAQVVEQPAAANQWASEFGSQQQAEPPHVAAMGANAQQWAAEFGSQDQKQQEVRGGVRRARGFQKDGMGGSAG